jgi:hypothetical protein
VTYSFRRLGDLLEDIRYRYSIGGVRNRHPPPALIRLYNVSWQQLMTIVSLADDGTFLEATAPAALPTTSPISGEVYSEIDWPIGASRIYGVRVQRSTSDRWYPLKKIPWAAFHDYQTSRLLTPWMNNPGPIGYCSRKIPSATEATENVGKVMVVPVPRGGLYRLWYMQAWQPQVEDDDLFAGHEEWHEWAIYNTLIKMLGPDADSHKAYPMFSAERAAARALIESTASRLSDGMALEPRDARGDGEDPYNAGEF